MIAAEATILLPGESRPAASGGRCPARKSAVEWPYRRAVRRGDSLGTARRVCPGGFLRLAETVAMHRDEGRWGLLYRVLFRITHGERHLLAIDIDDDVRRLKLMEKAVRRDMHKMTAFVRFRRVEGAIPKCLSLGTGPIITL